MGLRQRFAALAGIGLALGIAPWSSGEPMQTPASPHARWIRGPSADPAFFPIGVWLQNPARAGQYRKAGFNLYVGLWKGPTEKQLAELKAAGMKVFCAQNEVGLAHLDDPIIVGWLHRDEPDNAQARPQGGYDPPVPSAEIRREYDRMRAADPSRPVLLNLGQGVAWDAWHGRGTRTNHPEDYPNYLRAADIVSFDIYPVTHSHPDVAGRLSFVGLGVERLRKWGKDEKIVWSFLECTRIKNPALRPTPAQVRSMAWLALIRGARGLVYFVHEWKPKFREAALLDDPEQLAAVTALNHEILRWAPLLNSPALEGVVSATTDPAVSGIAWMVKQGQDGTYLFAMECEGHAGTAQFEILRGARLGLAITEVEDRKPRPLRANRFEETFDPWQVRIYRITPALR
jgi:hypothetical protein